MSRRADIARRHWIASAVDHANRHLTTGTELERAAVAMKRVDDLVERGNIEISVAVRRQARKEWNAWTAEVAARLVPPRLVGHQLVRHAAHYMYGTGGHDLELWVIESVAQPTFEQLVALGVAADASYDSGHRTPSGRQGWQYLARRPFSPPSGHCPHCPAARMEAVA